MEPESLSHDATEEILDPTKSRILYECARGEIPGIRNKFKRFETLSLLSLYHYQDELVRLEVEISSQKGFTTQTQLTKCRDLLKDYHEAILRFRDISQMARPEIVACEKTINALSDVMKEPHYKSARDALSLLNLSPYALKVKPEPVL